MEFSLKLAWEVYKAKFKIKPMHLRFICLIALDHVFENASNRLSIVRRTILEDLENMNLCKLLASLHVLGQENLDIFF